MTGVDPLRPKDLSTVIPLYRSRFVFRGGNSDLFLEEASCIARAFDPWFAKTGKRYQVYNLDETEYINACS